MLLLKYVQNGDLQKNFYKKNVVSIRPKNVSQKDSTYKYSVYFDFL